jgi:hypothetical protein
MAWKEKIKNLVFGLSFQKISLCLDGEYAQRRKKYQTERKSVNNGPT